MKTKKQRIIIILSVIAFMILVTAGGMYYRLHGSARLKPSAEYKASENAVIYRQDDPSWAKDQLGESKYTMESSGCLVSCIAAAVTMKGKEITPGELNQLFSDSHVYDAEGNIQWNSIDQMEGYRTEVFTDVSDSHIESCLESGSFPIVRVRMGGLGNFHYVLIIGAENGEYICMDPLRDDLTKLSDYGKRVYAIRCVRYEEDEEDAEDLVLFDDLSHIAVIVDHETMETESYELPEGSSYVCGDEEKLYYVCEEPKEAYYQIYAIDRRDKETTLVGEKYMKGKMEGAYLAAVESFKGKLYVLWVAGGFEEDHAFRESVYVLQEDGTYRETEDHQNVYDSMAENGYRLIRGGRRMNRARLYTIPLCMEMFGEIYAETPDGKSIVVLDQGGEVKRTLTYPDALSSVVFLGENTMLYIDEDKKLMLYDWNQNMSEVVMEKYHHILDYEDGILYYYESSEVEYAVWEYEVYQYDMEKRKTALLYSVRSVPGIPIYEPGISGFCVKEGICYYIGTDGTDAAWYLYDLHTKEEKMLKTDVKLWHYSYSDYGTITYKSETAVCPNCGKELCSAYDERFILDDSFPNAEKINACLLEDYEQTMDDVEKYTKEEQNQCEWHDEEDGPLETIQRGVRNVKTVGGHYLQVYMGGYWYGGGAHGMPIMDYLLFDLDTGEPVTFRELYRGSEEEFKELAVEYTVENWKKGENGYFAQTEEELAKEVYESVTLDMLIRFDENGIVLEYSPYWLGSYASGFIEVSIPYEALELDEKFVK